MRRLRALASASRPSLPFPVRPVLEAVRRGGAAVKRAARRGARPPWRTLACALATVRSGVAGLRGCWPSRRRALALAFSVLILAPLAGLSAWILWPLPEDVARPAPVPGLVLEDRYGRVLRTTRAPDGSRGGWLPLAEMDPELIRAFIAAEDHRFFDHHGVDLRAAARAARDNLAARRIVAGGSTITMQLARMLRPIPRTWLGKARQALWALRIEAHLDKAAILEAYLNRVPLGQAAVGVEAASQLYFGASAARLGLGQAALLAALARAPSRDNPLVAPERARERRARVLQRMVALGYVRPEEAARAAAEPVLGPGAEARFLAPHFTTYVLLQERGAPHGVRRTTLDLDLQAALEAEVRHTVRVLRDRAVQHAAAVVLDNATGGVLAWVGSPDFWADTAGQVDMVVSPRQPGSALKPFLYGLAFDRGYSPATVLPDVPTTFATSTGPYTPQNYDRRFRGPVRLREALASSYNVVAVLLAERLGAGALLATLHDAGFASLTRSADHYGLGLALGNGEVTLLEVANAYRGIANGGVWRPVTWFMDEAGAAAGAHGGAGAGLRTAGAPAGVGPRALRADLDGAASLRLVGHAPRAGDADGGRRFMSAGAAALVLDILSDPVARIPGFGVETPLDLPFPAAAKTGTSRHFTDNWAVATTANFTVAVWVGNFSGRPMQGVSGITGAGPLLHRAALLTARRYPPGRFPTPDMVGAVPVQVCILSGLRATPECPSMTEWFLPGTEPTRVDDWQRGGRTVLPPEYAEWAAQHGDALLAAAGDPEEPPAA
ncbi:MAG TPA: transglycosylase domain-containing protein, partial [Longimicrobiales bacterium]